MLRLSGPSHSDRGRNTTVLRCNVHREHFVFFLFNLQVIRRKDTSALFPDSPPPPPSIPPSLVVVSLLCVLYGRASPCLVVKIEFPTWVFVLCVLVCLRSKHFQMLGVVREAGHLFLISAVLSEEKNPNIWTHDLLRREFYYPLYLQPVFVRDWARQPDAPAQADRCSLWEPRHLVTLYFIQTSAAAGFRMVINPLQGMISALLSVEWAFLWM